MATHLSVNINKLATLRNSRGGNNPDVVRTALDIERWGADGITVHPRPDERHIRYADVRALKEVLRTELNIEGNPKEPAFVRLVLETLPAQVTLVPDAPGQLTSNHGWDVVAEKIFLREMVAVFAGAGIRTSVFIDPDVRMAAAAAETGVGRVELYTEEYARQYLTDKERAVAPYREAAKAAVGAGIGVNAGHDLDLKNLAFFAKQVAGLDEVSIGHALVCDALYVGLENAVQLYQRTLGRWYGDGE